MTPTTVHTIHKYKNKKNLHLQRQKDRGNRKKQDRSRQKREKKYELLTNLKAMCVWVGEVKLVAILPRKSETGTCQGNGEENHTIVKSETQSDAMRLVLLCDTYIAHLYSVPGSQNVIFFFLFSFFPFFHCSFEYCDERSINEGNT